MTSAAPAAPPDALVEAVPALTPRQVAASYAGTVVAMAQAVLTGGYHGVWLDGEAASDAVVSRAGMSEVGGSLGADGADYANVALKFE